MKTVHPHEAGVELLVEQHLSKEGAKKDIVFAVFASHGIALEIDQRGPTVRIYVHSRYGGQWHREHAMFAIKGPHAAAPLSIENKCAQLLLQTRARTMQGVDDLKVSYPRSVETWEGPSAPPESMS